MASYQTQESWTLPEAGIWPRTTPRYTESKAEQKLYDVIKAQLPNGWYAWHSLTIMREETKEFGQVDFIIAVPNRPAIILIEVKGGNVEQRDGLWFQNGKQLKKQPLEQQLKFRSKLISRFWEKGLTRKNGKSPEIGFCFCFPDTPVLTQPNQDGIKGATFGAESLPYFDKIIRQIIGNVLPAPWKVRNKEWISVIHEIWGECWISDLDIPARIKNDETKRIKLDQDQLSVLDSLDENYPRLIVNGSAGTGKTLLACEAAVRKADRGEKVLLACYTEALGSLLKKATRHKNITTGPIRRLAIKFLEDRGEKVVVENTKEFWNGICRSASAYGMPPVEDRWDCVIIDEGQDLTEDDWNFVKKCAAKTDRIVVFADETQAFWGDRRIPQLGPHIWYRHNLGTAYRCPPPIQILSGCYAGYCEMDVEAIKEAIQDNVIKLIESTQVDLCKTIKKEIESLMADGVGPKDIAIISARGMGDADNIMNRTSEFSGLKIVPATDPNAESAIVCDTFLRFKGLQRPVIIVTDLRLVSSRFYDIRMHLAISRSQSLLRIVTGKEEFLKDDRLSSFI